MRVIVIIDLFHLKNRNLNLFMKLTLYATAE